MIEGGCLCGNVRYQVSGFRGNGAHCHCSMCRRTHGAAFGTYATVQENGFQWIQGEAYVKSYRSSPGVLRTFCSECGSTLQMIFERDKEAIIDITLGTVDGVPGVCSARHIFVGSKAPWYPIEDELPQSDEWQ